MNAHAQTPQANVLASRAMLAGLKISTWTARKLDVDATIAAGRQYNAKHGAVRVNKSLVAKEALARVNAAYGEARRLYYARTLPWLDEGLRTLPSKDAEPFDKELRQAIAKAEALADDFAAAYPGLVEEARKPAPDGLGELFNEADYPNPSEIRGKFGASLRYAPIPDAADFRCTLSPEQAAKIKADLDLANVQALTLARRDAWERVAEVVGAMVERLAAYRPPLNGEKAQGIFRDSIVTNVIELANQLPTLNLADDSRLNKIATDMGDQLTYYSANELRENADARRETLIAAQAIMGEVAHALAA